MQRRFYEVAEGPDHETHDFPTSYLGLKLGGFMILSNQSEPDREPSVEM